MYCKNCGNQIDNNAAICVKCGATVGTGTSYCSNCGNPVMPGAAACTNCGALVTPPINTATQKSKLVAGLLAIFVGTFGVHNFYLGNKNKGLIQVLVSTIGGIFTCGIASLVIYIWAIVEGIMILTGSINTDADGVPLKD